MMEDFTADDLREMVLRLAHEIRNPLATIQSAVQVEKHLGEPNKRKTSYAEVVLTEVARINATLMELQRFVELEAKPARPVAVAQAIIEAVERAQEQAELATVRLVTAGGPQTSLLIDRDHLQTALTELLGNAIRSSPLGATVSVSWERNDQEVVAVHIDDQGPGVRPEHVNRILRPFFSTEAHATGLGLNVTQRICQLAGGDLRWRNRPFGGCRFTLELPEAFIGSEDPST
jgi:signal transduction histidine kinase